VADPHVYRNCVRALLLFDEKVIRRVARKLKVSLPVDGEPAQLAEHLVRGLFHATHFWGCLTASERDAVGTAFAIGIAKDWQAKMSAEKIAALPFYARPSWEKDVFAVLVRETAPRRPAKRRPTKTATKPASATGAGAWPPLTSRVTAELALALGDGFEPRAPGRIWNREAEVILVAVRGGTFQMGLRPADRRQLEARARKLGPEAVERAAAIVRESKPVRTVRIAPFLLAQTAVTRASTRDAARTIERIGARFPSEAEWEYVARGAGGMTWLPNPAIRRGVRDLDWSDWVGDGWHESYRGAPKNGAEWDPRVFPEMARGGLRQLWPWQSGEEIQMLVAARLHDPSGEHGVRPAFSFPPRVARSRR